MYSRPLPRSRAASNTRASHVASYTSEDRRPWLQSAELATPAQPIAGAPSFHDHCRPPADRRRAHRYHIQQPKPASHRAASGPRWRKRSVLGTQGWQEDMHTQCAYALHNKYTCTLTWCFESAVWFNNHCVALPKLQLLARLATGHECESGF